MPVRGCRKRVLQCCFAAALPCLPAFAVSSAQEPAVAAPGETVALVQPTRRAPDAPPEPPPPLPVRAEHVTPLTLHTIVRRQAPGSAARVLRQTISRTADRVHVATRDGREWLFVRNARDPRRVSGFLVEPAARAIVVYDESDLRNLLGIRGWADALLLGFDLKQLEGLKPTRETRSLGGIRFVRYAGSSPATVSRDAWWSADQVMPCAFVRADHGAVTRFSVERIRPGIDPSLLRPPASRFPQYRVIDLADSLERH